MNFPLPAVLIVDDLPADRQAMAAMLEGERCRVVTAAGGLEALRCALHEDFAVIVLDANMPDLNGFETAQMLRDREGAHGAPMIIMVASSLSPRVGLSAYGAGAVDFLTKPLGADVFRAKVRVYLQLGEARLRLRGEAVKRQAVSDELREVNMLQRGILNSANLAIISTDISGRVRSWNTGAERMLGWTATDVVGQFQVEQFFEADTGTGSGSDVWKELSNTALGGRPAEAEGRSLRFDGSRLPVEISITMLRNAEDEVNGFLIIITDITRRKESEAALKSIEWMLSKRQGPSTEGTPKPIAQPYGDLTLLNTDRTILDAVGKDLLGDIVGDFMGLLETSSAVYEKNGDYAFGIFTSGWCQAMDAASRRGCGTDDDRAALACGKWHCHESCWNEASRRSMETKQPADIACQGGIRLHAVPIYAGDDIVGSINFGYGEPPRDPALLLELAAKYGLSVEEMRRAAAAYQKRPAYIIDLAKNRLLGAARLIGEIVQRKRAGEDLRRAHEDLRRANHELAMASRLKDEFLANMSHELRTPLNAILGLSEALLEQASGPLTPRQVKSLTTISTSGQHLLALINDILDLSKIEAGKLELRPEPLNVEEFCQSCLAFVKSQAMQKRIDVAFEPCETCATLQADPKRFKQILVNLLTNAVKFTPEGGRVGLAVASPEGGEAVRFTVWDTGIGIATDDAAKLFRAFTQIDSGLNRSQEGTGLGLALVAKLVELHGGSVELLTEPGRGSRFTVTLPVAPTPGSAGVPPAESGVTPDSTPPHPSRMAQANLPRSGDDGRRDAGAPQPFRRALIIEDDATAGEQLEHYLKELGLSSALHVRGEESIEAVLRERPDVILLDILLPNESGWVVLAKLKEHPRTSNIPVVVVSVVDEPGKSRALGAAAHFTKPVSREQLAGFLKVPLPERPAPAPPRAAPAPPAGPRILLAEDNEANIQTIGGYLEDKGYAMIYALNGAVAVKLTKELRPALILMDIQMPVMDGLTAIRQIRADAAFKDIPIVALTALAMPGDRERCLAAGATDYLSKPVKLKELAELVEKRTNAERTNAE